MAKGERGFTIIEVLIAMALFAILMGCVLQVYMLGGRSYKRLSGMLEVQQNLRIALYYLGREIRMAGYEGENPVNRYGAGIVRANSEVLKISFLGDDDGLNNDKEEDDETDEAGELSTVTYELYDAYRDGDTDLGRTPDDKGNLKRAIAENIDRIEFLYVLEDGTELKAPDEKQMNKIEMIRITLLARSEKKFRNLNGRSYRFETPGGGVWEYNDGYYRKMMSTNVYCRNMRLRFK